MTLGLTMFMGAAVFAQTQQGTQQGTTTDRMNQEQRDQDRKDKQDKDKKDIDKSDLPEEVRNAFDESQYSSWNVEDVWEMDSNEQATAQGQAGQTGQAGASMDGKTYLIKVKDSNDKAIGLHYDASGTLLETKTDMDKKDKKDKKDKY